MGRRKTTVYVDADVLTVTKVPVARESQVVEEALRAYLRVGVLEAAGDICGR